MFEVDGGCEDRVVYADRNVEKFDGRVRDSAREFEGSVEVLKKVEEEDQIFSGK